MVCMWCTLKATSSLSFRSEIVKEKKNKRVSTKSIAARQARTLAFKDVGDFRPRSLVYFCKGIPGLANRIETSRHEICLDVPHTLTICSSSCLSSVIFLILLVCSLFVFKV